MIKEGLVASQQIANVRKNGTANNSLALAYYPAGEPGDYIINTDFNLKWLYAMPKIITSFFDRYFFKYLIA